MSDTTSATPTRRKPSQERGQQRIDRILDAAAEVIADVGVQAATTNAIAARAGTAIGSLYHFFPNKDAIVVALDQRYAELMRTAGAEALRPEMAMAPLGEMMEHIVATLAVFHERNPAYRHVYHALADPGQAVCGSPELQSEILAMIVGLLKSRAPHLSDSQRQRSAIIYMEMVHALLETATLASAEEREPLKAELTRVMRLYAADLERQSAEQDAAE